MSSYIKQPVSCSMATNSAKERFDTEVTIVDVLRAIHNQIYIKEKLANK